MKLNPFQLERYFAQHEFSAPYLLCSSDCESLALGDLLALEANAQERFAALWLGYTESQGNPELRQAIATLYTQATADQILVHAGAEEAIFNFMNVLLTPGDHIVVHAPYYQSLGEVARGIGAEVSEWQGNPERAWALDLDDLAPRLTDRTQAVVVNFPHNPTGFLPDAAFAHGLVALSERHGFVIFADEVYRGLELDPADRLPAFADLSDRALSLGVMSKTYGLAGLRIGWIATRNQALFKALAAFKDYTTICNSAPSEFLATLALRHGETIVARNLQIIRDNLDRLDRFFEAYANRFTWQRPQAGSIAFPLLSQGSVDDFCADLVKQAGVLLLPGTLYGSDCNGFRIGFGRKNLPESLHRLEGYLQQL
ncbi:MAG: aminotransferase class I/II-fold pyridoxal phosphate-dependent enzyme [Cyanobacteria bacterium]|nr:aminotransferase class I/II-fold pyridoxal phosphate-dependent enzyme [Cyanobacteriota bacterium]